MPPTTQGSSEPKYLPMWAYIVTFAITAFFVALMVIGVAWAIAWAFVAVKT